MDNVQGRTARVDDALALDIVASLPQVGGIVLDAEGTTGVAARREANIKGEEVTGEVLGLRVKIKIGTGAVGHLGG